MTNAEVTTISISILRQEAKEYTKEQMKLEIITNNCNKSIYKIMIDNCNKDINYNKFTIPSLLECWIIRIHK